MTKRQSILFAVLATAAAALFVGLHMALPIDQSWSVNRILNYAWDGALAAGVIGAALWLFWPNHEKFRKDEKRERARRCLIALAAVVVGAAMLVIFGELRREHDATARLETARPDLEAIHKALAVYAADHAGAPPESLAGLVPKYLPPAQAYYAYRDGPRRASFAHGWPPATDPSMGDDQPTYVLAKQPPAPPDAKPAQDRRMMAYLKVGCSWAPLTVILESDGRVRVVSDDVVRRFEKQ